MKTFFQRIIKIWFHCLNTTDWGWARGRERKQEREREQNRWNDCSFSFLRSSPVWFAVEIFESVGQVCRYTFIWRCERHFSFCACVWTSFFNSDFVFQPYFSKLTQKNANSCVCVCVSNMFLCFSPSLLAEFFMSLSSSLDDGMARRSHVTIQQYAQRIKIQHNFFCSLHFFIFWKAIHLIWNRQRGLNENDIVFIVCAHWVCTFFSFDIHFSSKISFLQFDQISE